MLESALRTRSRTRYRRVPDARRCPGSHARVEPISGSCHNASGDKRTSARSWQGANEVSRLDKCARPGPLARRGGASADRSCGVDRDGSPGSRACLGAVSSSAAKARRAPCGRARMSAWARSDGHARPYQDRPLTVANSSVSRVVRRDFRCFVRMVQQLLRNLAAASGLWQAPLHPLADFRA